MSAGTGLAVLYALIRGFLKTDANSLGNFWVDLTRSVLYILMPLSLVLSLLLVSQGVIQNLKPGAAVSLVEPVAVSEDGTILTDIEIVNGEVYAKGQKVDAQIVTEQFVPMGPAASQIAIKQLGTNGGGYMGTNSAHPLENPTYLSNLAEVIAILLIPAALCFSFGQSIKDKRQTSDIYCYAEYAVSGMGRYRGK